MYVGLENRKTVHSRNTVGESFDPPGRSQWVFKMCLIK
jgi:hypothetical protein